jgi:hypothetical protein
MMSGATSAHDFATEHAPVPDGTAPEKGAGFAVGSCPEARLAHARAKQLASKQRMKDRRNMSGL